MMNTPINLQSKFELFSELWSPKVVAEMNDYQFKLVKSEGISHGMNIKTRMKYSSSLKVQWELNLKIGW